MTRLALLLALLTAAGPATASAQSVPSPYGADLRLALRDGKGLRGELLAVQGDTLILLYQRRLVPLLIQDVAEARVPWNGLSDRRVMKWTFIGGGLSAVGMALACLQLDDSDCGPVLPAVGVAWGIFGGLSALLSGPDTRRVQVTPHRLEPYARFPQGLPTGFDPSEEESGPSRGGAATRSGSPIRLRPQY